MKSELTKVSPTQREIKIEIDPAALKEAYGKVSQKYAKRVTVPGFRKGFAPLDVIRLRYRDEIKSDVLQDVVPTAISDAIIEHNLQPLAEPQLHLDDPENIKLSGSQPVTLHVHVEVMPEIPIPKYKGVEVTRRVRPTEEAEIEDVISQRLKKEAALIPVEGRKSQVGDTVIADLEGTFADDPSGEPITAENLEIVLGDGSIEESFTENLAGVVEDDEKEFTVTYADTFSSEALAGKTVNYKAKIKSVALMEQPEPNDEWAKSLDEGYESLADLRQQIRSDLAAYAKADADARVSNAAVEKLIADNAFEVPNTLIESQARNLLNNFAKDMQQRGVDLTKIDESFVQMAYENMRMQAERDVRGAMLLEKVAELEKAEVTDAEVDEEISKMAEYYRASAEEVRASLEKQGGGVDNIRNNLKTRKAIEALVAKAKITEGEWIDESATPEIGAQEAEQKPKEAKKKEPAKKAAKKAL